MARMTTERPARKEKKAPKISTIDGLAGMIAEMHADLEERFDKIDDRFGQIDNRFEEAEDRFGRIEENVAQMRLEMQSGFTEQKKILDRIETRIAALEFAVFGVDMGSGRRATETSFSERLSRLEETVFHH